MSDEAKLGLVAGVLAVVGVAVFGMPKDPLKTAKPEAAVTIRTPAASTPAAVNVANKTAAE